MSDVDPGFDRARRQALWVLWATYGSFYFCRTNISAAVPELSLTLSKTEIGFILGAFKFMYGIGQLINGQLAERIAPRRLLAIGMLGSAALNALLGVATGFYFLLFVWATNGYAQALGWAPTMRVAAGWFAPETRGRAIAIIGTGYQLAGALTFVIAGWAADQFGWRGAGLVPAGLLALSAVHMLVTLREAPTDRAVAHPQPRSWTAGLAATLRDPRLWCFALALGLLNACRYGFSDWGIAHLREMQGDSVGVSALKYAVLPCGGILGTLAAGWITDRALGGRRVPAIAVMLVGLCATVIAYDALVQTNLALSIVALGLVGALIFGPQVMLVGTAPVDVAAVGAAAAVGFVDFVGYLGAFSGDQVTGYLAEHYDWHAAIMFWAACAGAAAVVVLPLWRARARARAG